jgi:quercetin dioxygenase-like cupin family protein
MSQVITNLQEALPVPADGIASRPLLDLKESTKLVLFALDAGQEISAHSAPFQAQVLLLAGVIEVMVEDVWHRLAPGDRIELPKGRPHGVRAVQASHFLLTMLRGL